MQRLMKALRLSIGAGVVASVLFVLGFVIFADGTTRTAEWPLQPADAIVVLTGGRERIGEGSRLLQAGRAPRLLISGVNPQISKEAARRLTGLDRPLFDCCVDVGYGAVDTSSNADETRAWVAVGGFSSLIVVTAAYHMPRSLFEMGRAMPGVRLIPHPVAPKSFAASGWLRVDAARIWVSEYVKYLRAAVRFAVGRLTPQQRAEAVTSVASHRNTKA
jgi:uncharacterized SAM-binding protein YcdF (DUF218 family)